LLRIAGDERAILTGLENLQQLGGVDVRDAPLQESAEIAGKSELSSGLAPSAAVFPFEAGRRASLGSTNRPPQPSYGPHDRCDASEDEHSALRVAVPAGKMPLAVFKGVGRPPTIFGR